MRRLKIFKDSRLVGDAASPFLFFRYRGPESQGITIGKKYAIIRSIDEQEGGRDNESSHDGSY
jgi:hypothetical protein